MEIRAIETLKEWHLNKKLRYITDEDFERVKNNLRMGQHTNLLIRPDGTVIGGNNRLRAMRELGYKAVKVNVLDFGQDEEGYYPVIDGEVYTDSEGNIPIHFKTIEQGELEMMYSHNMRGASDVRDEVANMVGNFPDIAWHNYDANFYSPDNISDLAESFEEGKDETEEEDEEGLPSKPKIVITFKDTENMDKAVILIEEVLAEFDVKITTKR